MRFRFPGDATNVLNALSVIMTDSSTIELWLDVYVWATAKDREAGFDERLEGDACCPSEEVAEGTLSS